MLGTTATELREWLESKIRTTSQQRTNWKIAGEEAGLSVDVIPAVYLQLYLAMRLGFVVPVRTPSARPAKRAVGRSLRRPRQTGSG